MLLSWKIPGQSHVADVAVGGGSPLLCKPPPKPSRSWSCLLDEYQMKMRPMVMTILSSANLLLKHHGDEYTDTDNTVDHNTMDTDNTMDHNTMDHEDDLMWGSAPTVTSRDLLSFEASTNSHSSTDTLKVVMIMLMIHSLILWLTWLSLKCWCSWSRQERWQWWKLYVLRCTILQPSCSPDDITDWVACNVNNPFRPSIIYQTHRMNKLLVKQNISPIATGHLRSKQGPTCSFGRSIFGGPYSKLPLHCQFAFRQGCILVFGIFGILEKKK